MHLPFDEQVPTPPSDSEENSNSEGDQTGINPSSPSVAPMDEEETYESNPPPN
ncbi:hypothetical protein PGTUg99_021587 [Puccinia graminis f. sp. tritici]|nr:hypothetical protein PGTUg99_021587 [Puccinia graminis f. sp. tritici]